MDIIFFSSYEEMLNFVANNRIVNSVISNDTTYPNLQLNIFIFENNPSIYVFAAGNDIDSGSWKIFTTLSDMVDNELMNQKMQQVLLPDVYNYVLFVVEGEKQAKKTMDDIKLLYQLLPLYREQAEQWLINNP